MGVQAIGERVRREEDRRLLTGRGRYVDDVAAAAHDPAARRCASRNKSTPRAVLTSPTGRGSFCGCAGGASP